MGLWVVDIAVLQDVYITTKDQIISYTSMDMTNLNHLGLLSMVQYVGEFQSKCVYILYVYIYISHSAVFLIKTISNSQFQKI